MTPGFRGAYRDLTMTLPAFGATSILLAVLVGGCQADQSGVGPATGGSSSGGGATEAGTAASTGPGTDAGSGDATAGSSTGASSTGVAEGTTGSSTAAPPESSSGSEGEDDGPSPPAGQPYGPCGPDGTCMGADVACYASDRLRTMCLPPCDGTNPSCPDAPPGNQALVECVQVMGVHCMLNCQAGGQDSCPEGTVCEQLAADVFRCLWP